MAESRKVHANLVHPSRLRSNFEKRVIQESLFHLKAGEALLAAFFVYAHFEAVFLFRGDGQINRPLLIFYQTFNERQIGLADLSVLELLRKLPVSVGILGKNDYSARLFVEPVNYKDLLAERSLRISASPCEALLSRTVARPGGLFTPMMLPSS